MILCLWPQCNNHCLMCTNPPDFGQQAVFYQKAKFLGRIKSLSMANPELEQLLLTGGEPTIHPDFLEILREVRRLLPQTQIKILTNGRTFFYEPFVNSVLKTGNLSLTFSFCGSCGRTHDAVTRCPGSFEQALVGLKNVLKYKNKTHHTEIRIVLTRFLLKENKEVFKFLNREFLKVDSVIFLFPEIEGICEQNLNMVAPTYKDVKQSDFFINFRKHQKKFKELRLYHFPLCVTPKSVWPNIWRTMDDDDTQYEKQCQQCVYQKECLGVPVGYKKFFGCQEFNPILKKDKKIKKTKNTFNPIRR